jgi:hypothetical protein
VTCDTVIRAALAPESPFLKKTSWQSVSGSCC